MKKTEAPLDVLEDKLDELLVGKAPALPVPWKEMIVKYSPWLTLFLMILSFPAIFALLGLAAVLAPVSYMGGLHTGVGYTISLVLIVVSLVLEAMAVPGLFKRSRKGWQLVFYSVLVSAVANLITGDISGFVIGTLISLYFLFQVKSYYR